MKLKAIIKGIWSILTSRNWMLLHHMQIGTTPDDKKVYTISIIGRTNFTDEEDIRCLEHQAQGLRKSSNSRNIPDIS